MTFEEYRSEHYHTIQKQILKICWIGSIITAVVEIIIFFVNLKHNYINDIIVPYILYRMLLPSGINISVSIFCTIILRKESISDNFKAYTISFATLICCTSIACIHVYYVFLLFCLMLPLFLCTVFGSEKLLRAITYASIFSYILASIAYYFEHKQYVVEHRLMSISCFWGLFGVSVLISVCLLRTQKKQIDFISENCAEQLKLIEELKIEPMTGLYNKGCLESCIKTYHRKFTEGLFYPSCCLIDLDHFKEINDTYGHQEGDIVLKRLSEVIKKDMGGIRRAFRFGGEEFVILWETAPLEEVIQKVEEIKSDFCNTQYNFDPELKVTFSAGICKLDESMTSDLWFKSTDETMYKAKQDGRNKICIYLNK